MRELRLLGTMLAVGMTVLTLAPVAAAKSGGRAVPAFAPQARALH